MATRTDIQFSLSLKNDASATLQQFKVDAESTMKAAGKAADEYGQKTKTLSQWIKEERAEQRQHNFLFAQTKEVVAGASSVLALYGNTLGQTSEAQKMLTNSMNAGFVAFQGVNNVIGLLGNSLKFLSGPWGIAISLTAAAAVAFSQFNSEAGKATEGINKLASEANDLDYQLGKISISARKAFLIKDIVDAQEKVDALKKTTTDWSTSAMQGFRTGLIQKITGTPEEILAAENGVRKAEQAFKTFYESTKDKANNKSVIQKLKEDLEHLKPGTEAYESKLRALNAAQRDYETAVRSSNVAIHMNDSSLIALSKTIDTKSVESLKKAKNGFKDLKLEIMQIPDYSSKYLQEVADDTSKELMNWQDGTSLLLNSMVTGFQAAFAGAEGSGKSFLKSLLIGTIDMVQGMIMAAEAASLAKATISWGATLIKDLPMLTLATAALQGARFVVNKFHDGGTMGPGGQRIPLASDERHAILRVGETVIPTKPGESFNTGTTINATININAPGTPEQMVLGALRRVATEIGANTLGDIKINQRNQIAFS